MLTISELKARAKVDMKKNMWLMIGTLFVSTVLFGLLSYTIVGSLLLAGPLSLGVVLFTIKLKRTGRAQFDDLFRGFNNFSVALATHVLRTIYTILWALLFIVPGIIKSLAYSQAMYILNDDPRLGSCAIEKSVKMMDGHKGRLFLLELSFIGWHLLAVLTFGLLEIFYVIPYYEMTLAEFYDDLKAGAALPPAEDIFGEPNSPGADGTSHAPSDRDRDYSATMVVSISDQVFEGHSNNTNDADYT